MALAIGFLLFLLGIVTYVAWLPATFYFLQGLTTFSLIFWGFLALLLGYSERKAKREFQRAISDETKDETDTVGPSDSHPRLGVPHPSSSDQPNDVARSARKVGVDDTLKTRRRREGPQRARIPQGALCQRRSSQGYR